jgi:Tfp pilus assembly protein FimT
MNRHVATAHLLPDDTSVANVQRRLSIRKSAWEQRSRRGAFSLVELLIVIVLTSILAQMAISAATPTAYDQLVSTANIIAGELAYARSLAVGNNGTYRFDIDLSGNRMVMRYTGSDSSLNTLPLSPYRALTDPSDQYIVALANLPRLGMPVSLLGAQSVGTTTQAITSVEFGPYGSTTQTNQSVIWLTAGVGTARRYISVSVNPVTGLASPGSFTSVAPAGMTIPSP